MLRYKSVWRIRIEINSFSNRGFNSLHRHRLRMTLFYENLPGRRVIDIPNQGISSRRALVCPALGFKLQRR